jgi:tRNA(Arg) A34 adenosine deaminase TadA/CheY-like chemotaxis protein
MAETKGQVLVLEPNDITRKLIVSILSKAGYATHEAAKSDEAVELLGRKPSLVIMDIEGDGADSYGFLKKMQKDHGKVPLIALAETGDRESLQQRINLPHVTFIDKPVNPMMVLSTVQGFLALEVPANAGGDSDVEQQRRIFMRRAIDLSQQKMDENCGGPFGAVIVKGGKIIGEGWNCVTSTNDPTAHAEMVAIRAAAAANKNFKLEGCEIYTSCEPCPMCLSAIYWARIDKIFYANLREDAERIGFDDAFLYAEVALPENKRSLPAYRLLREEAKIVFENWQKKQDKTAY